MQVSIRDVHTTDTLASSKYTHSTLLSSCGQFGICTDERKRRRRHCGVERETQISARLLVLMMTLLRIQVFWAMMPCRLYACVCVVFDISGTTKITMSYPKRPESPDAESGCKDGCFVVAESKGR
jgi:hypothetical protein